MWPLDLPARDVLKLPRTAGIAWAVFDPVWYRLHYPEAADQVSGESPAKVLQYYLETGQSLGHGPNRMFDEQWHRTVYPQIAERVAAGLYSSAFDAYCRRGSLDRSPHWLFDELAYRGRYQDLSNDVLSGAEVVNGYDHYLRHGIAEDRIGHLLFDPATYLSNFDAADILAIRRQGVFQHYLSRIESAEPELRTSIYFDPVWYLNRYPKWPAKSRAGGGNARCSIIFVMTIRPGLIRLRAFRKRTIWAVIPGWRRSSHRGISVTAICISCNTARVN